MFSAEQLEIRALAREFAEGELRPHTSRWDRDRALDDDIFGKLAELGFLGMRVPERYGGLGLDMSTYLLALEELAWGDASVALSVAIHTGPVTDLLLEYGSDEQKETWLSSLASGEILGAFALSETPSGSDVRSVDTTAVPEGAGWRIDGHKRWVTNGARSGLVFVFATTGGDENPTLGAFIVSPQGAGYAVTATETTMGLRASEIVSVELDGIQVPSDRVLGDSANGLEYAPDYVINAGGLCSVYGELHGWTAERTQKKAGAIYDTLLGIFERAANDGISTSDAADRLACQRIMRARGLE